MKKGVLGSIGALLFIFVGLKWHSVSFFPYQKHSYSHSGLLSSDSFSAITRMVDGLLIKKASAHMIIKNIQEQFPMISGVTISYCPQATHVGLRVDKPTCIINDAFICTKKNELYDKKYFSNKALEGIPVIAVAENFISDVTSYVSHLLRFIPRDCVDSYAIELVNEHTIYFHDKNDEQFTVVASLHEDIPCLLAQCGQIKENIKKRKGFDSCMSWVTDGRFKPYIVAYKL